MIVCIKITNIDKHEFLFYSENKKIFTKAKDNAKKTHKKNKQHTKDLTNKPAILCEKFTLKRNQIKLSTLGGKGRYIISIPILGASGSNDYKIKLKYEYKNLKLIIFILLFINF